MYPTYTPKRLPMMPYWQICMATMNLILIKLGGSVITDKQQAQTLRPKAINVLAGEIAAVSKEFPTHRLVLGNGAGSFGHYMVRASRYQENQANETAIQAIRESVATLNRVVVATLKKAGQPAKSLPPHTFVQKRAGTLSGSTEPVFAALREKVTPVVYGDIVADNETATSVASTEELLRFIAASAIKRGHRVEHVIYLTGADGVLNGSDVIPKLTTKQAKKLAYAHEVNYDVTGGMLQKVTEGFKTLPYAKRITIASGLKPGTLRSILKDEPTGTRLVDE